MYGRVHFLTQTNFAVSESEKEGEKGNEVLTPQLV
jgi:hypothetical protein